MPFQPGDQVRLRTDRLSIGVVTAGPQPIADTYQYQIRIGAELKWVLEQDLELVTAKGPDTLFIERSFDGHDSLLRLVTYHRLTKPFADTILTRHASKIDFLPYQWLPLLRLLDTADQRILIADEVGLGKTIEAGIIHRELSARKGGLKRVLVVARTGELNRQWEGELRERFGEDYEFWDRQKFIEWIIEGEREQYWDSIHAIVGRHTLQRDPALSAILQICTRDGRGVNFSHPNIDLDLLIVDESHHMRNPNNLHKAIHWLAQCAKTVLFLTATPIHLGNDDLYNQLQILLPKRFANETFFQDELRVHQHVLQAIRLLNTKDDENLRKSLNNLADGDDISDLINLLDDIEKPETRARLKQQIESFSPLANVINRTTRRDLPNVDWPQRNAISVKHSLTEAEKELYLQLIIQHYEAMASGLSFGKTTALRLAATCMPIAMLKYGLNIQEEEWEEESTDERGEMAIAEPGQIDFEYLARRPDSRFKKMWEALEGIWRETPKSKVIIFSFFVDVLDYLSKRLQKLGIARVVVHGRDPLDRSEREVRYEEFKNNPEIRLLLSSEVGTEGLNLQVADTIVNYNLPWNPMVVEQRIGRIDRKGQKSLKIRIVNLFAEGTIEDKVIGRLLERIRIFESSIGDLEPILGKFERTIAKDFLDPNLSDEEIKKRTEELAGQFEHERLNIQRLEEAAREQLIADLPFNPMEKAMEEGRYVSPEHIRLLIEGFIKRETPDSEFKMIRDGIWRINIRQDFFKVLTDGARALQLNHIENAALQRALHTNSLLVTFNAENATERAVELVASGHWLTRIICKELKGRELAIHPVSAIQIKTSIPPAGYYAFGLFSLDMTGLKEKRLFIPVFISLKDGSVCHEAQSNEILSAMLLKGQGFQVNEMEEEWDLSQALRRLRDEFHNRSKELFHDFEREIHRFKRLRCQTEEKYANSEIQRIRETIAGLHTEEQRRILPALEQNIRNLETARDNEIAQLNSINPSRSHQEIGFGLLHIIN